MILSFALILLLGMLLGNLSKRLGLPALLGMLITGILLGPGMLNWLDASLLDISSVLRQIALIIILTRAGLNLNIDELKQVGRPAILMCFVPATFEICGTMLLAPRLLGMSLVEAAVLGTVIAAVSPAVIVPQMLKLMDEGYGTRERIPQMIMAGASADDVFVIVLFSAATSMAQSGTLDAMSFVEIPTSILFGILGGVVCGIALAKWFEKVHMRDSSKVLILLSIAGLLVTLQDQMTGYIGFSGLLAVMAMGITLKGKRPVVAVRLSAKFERLWVAAEVLLFALVGAAVDMKYVIMSGIAALILLAGALICRMVGVYCCLLGTSFRKPERLFCMIAYCPKATVQAAIGAVPLSMGLACGHVVLSVAVLSILLTAPLGALVIGRIYPKMLQKDPAK